MSAVTAPSQWIEQIHRLQRRLGERTSRRQARPPACAVPRTDRNQAALAAYLLAILSPLPFFGLLFGMPALYLGIRGLRFAHHHPQAGGEAQSWIGVAMGGVFSAVYLVAVGFLVTVLAP